MRAAPWYRLPALGWLMARAFAPSPVLAAVAAPAAVVSLVPYALRGAVFESADRDGMVIFGRYRPVADVLIAVPVVLACFVVALAALAVGALTGIAGFGVALLVVGLSGLGNVALLTSTSFTTAVGPETPAGRRWTVMGLAQRPGTRLSALLLARELVGTVPPGEVVVAVAAREELAEGYRGLGFSRGSGARVFRVVPPSA